MSHELLYTSAPRGLKPGSRGFCTVLSTQGMPAPLAIAVEALSGYRPLYPSNDDRASRNPVVYSHLKLQATGRTCHVLSRIADYGLDYSQRANKLAHHVILESTAERLSGGPANLLSMPGFMREEWSGEPKVVAIKPVTREPRPAHGICRQWQELTGDAGWAGVLAESFLRDPERLVILLFAPGQEILPLIAESLSLLPAEKRWDVTFSTYFTSLAPGTTCIWRAIVHDSKEAHESLRFVHALRIDLTEEGLPPATGGELVAAARSGTYAESTPRRSPPPLTRDDENSDEAESSDTIDEFRQTEQDSHNSANPRRLPPQHARPNSPIAYPVAQQAKRTGRSLADVIEEEAQRPPRRRWIWIAIPVVVLLIAAGVTIFVSWGNRRGSNIADDEKSLGAVATAVKPNEEDQKAAVKTPNDKTNIMRHSIDDGKPVTISHDKPTPKPSDTPNSDHTNTQNQKKEKISQIKTSVVVKNISVKKDISTKEKSTTLHSFAIPDREIKPNEKTAPSMKLFKPDWLNYKSRNGKAGIENIFVEKTVEITVARIVTEASKTTPKIFEYKIQNINNTEISMLRWCRIQILSNESSVKEVKFIDFPMNATDLEKVITKNGLQWTLPPDGFSEYNIKPKLILKTMKVVFDNQEYELVSTQNTSSTSWSLPCEEFEKTTYETLSETPSATRKKLTIEIEMNPVESTVPANFSFRLTNKESFLKPIEERLNKRLKNITNELRRLSEDVNLVEEQKTIRSTLGDIGIKKLINAEQSDNIRKSIADTVAGIEKQREGATQQKQMEIDENKKELELQGVDFDRTVKQINTLVRVSQCLNTVKIRAMHCFYVLSDAQKNSTSQPINVDVINFDDTPQAGANP